MKFLFCIALFFQSILIIAQQLDIGIMRDYTIGTLEIKHHKGNYSIIGDSVEISNVWKGQTIRFKRSGEKIKVIKADKTLGFFDSIYVKEMTAENSLRLQCLAPSSKKSRRYEDDFILTPEGAAGIRLINHVEIQNYLGGVIESEGGGGKHIEYYKVQAILSRTYALGHLSKHKDEGFQLCDRVHCQAYHNMLIYTPRIDSAVTATKGVVMLNKRLDLAEGFFFANCGGQTCEADFVWNRPVSHCKSIVDTFCIHSRQANWEKKIDANKWRNYLVNHFGYPINDPVLGPEIYDFEQKARKAFYKYPQLGIPLRDLRVKFRLKSTWFSCKKNGNYVVLKGKGFGHGVGLCQEGAMNMAKSGYSADQILNYYFSDIHLMNYFNWSFLKQKETEGIEF